MGWDFRSEIRGLSKMVMLPHVRGAFNVLVMNTARDRHDPNNIVEFSEGLKKAIRAKYSLLAAVDGTEARAISKLEQAGFEDTMTLVSEIRSAAISEVENSLRRFGDTSNEEFFHRIRANIGFVEQACRDALGLMEKIERERNAVT